MTDDSGAKASAVEEVVCQHREQPGNLVYWLSYKK